MPPVESCFSRKRRRMISSGSRPPLAPRTLSVNVTGQEKPVAVCFDQSRVDVVSPADGSGIPEPGGNLIQGAVYVLAGLSGRGGRANLA